MIFILLNNNFKHRVYQFEINNCLLHKILDCVKTWFIHKHSIIRHSIIQNQIKSGCFTHASNNLYLKTMINLFQIRYLFEPLSVYLVYFSIYFNNIHISKHYSQLWPAKVFYWSGKSWLISPTGIEKRMITRLQVVDIWRKSFELKTTVQFLIY